MRIEITLNGEILYREIPTSLDQVKFKKLLKINKNKKDTTNILAVLTDLDYEDIKRAKITNVEDVILALSFFQQEYQLTIPETILGYKVPKDLGFETTAQYEDLKLHLKECGEKKLTEVEQLAFYPLYCAIYACSQEYGSYDWQKAEQMAETFMNAPATEVLAIGNFTLLKLIKLNLGIKNSAHQGVTRMRRLRLVLRAWVKSLVLPVRLAIWKKKHRIKKVSY